MKMVPANEPWLDQVPSDWSATRIRNVAQLSPGFSGGAPDFDELCTVVPMELVSESGVIDTSIQHRSEDINGGLTLFEDGDVIFAKITPCMENGKGAFVTGLPTKYAFGSTEFHVLRPRHGIDGRFLYYYTFNFFYRSYAAENMFGAAGQKRVSSRFLKDTRLFLPPFTEQKRIAAYLDASCPVIDAAVAAKRRQIETLEELRKSTVHRAVTQGLSSSKETRDHEIPGYGATPQHWRRSKLRYEISIRNGDFASDKLRDGGEYPVLGGNGIMGRIDFFNVDGETIVIGRIGAYCGNAHYIRGKAWVSDNALIVKSRHHAQFLCHLFNILNFNTQANNTAQPVITGTKIKSNYVILPPKGEQTEIALFIERKTEGFDALRTNFEEQISTLLAYRKSLIHECVTGQRRVTDADVDRVRRGGLETVGAS